VIIIFNEKTTRIRKQELSRL